MLQASSPSQPLIKLVGIARLAAEGSLVSGKRRVEYRSLPTRKWLNRCHSERVPFHWTINPYRGCEFGCKYCYARFTHEFLERRELDSFETEIYAKDWNAEAFERELSTVKRGQVIGLGTATDPYQPAERTFKLTRRTLEVMAGTVRGISLFVTTKSDLVSRDADLYRRIGERNRVRVSMTITTMRRELARLTEPFAPRPDLRIKAVAELARAGVSVGVIASPILPMITDSEENLTQVAEAAKQRRCQSVRRKCAVPAAFRAQGFPAVCRAPVPAIPEEVRSQLPRRRLLARSLSRPHGQAGPEHPRAGGH